MSDKRDVPLEPPADTPGRPDATRVHGPLGVEKLEGRQESGRDEQDEAEEDERSDRGA